MFSFLVLVFRSIFGKRDEPDLPARVVYEVTTLVAYAGTPAVQKILSEAQETYNQELLDQFHLAQQELNRKNETRRRETSASRPVLEGSPTTWGWKVDHAAQLAAIRQGLEDAIDSTIFDPKQPRTGPNPLTGHMMKDMFYEYHDKHPQLRNLPASRRSTDELIWTIETFPNGSSKWKITMSSSLAASVLSNLSENSSTNSSITMADAPQQTQINTSISMKKVTSIKSVDDPSHHMWDTNPANRAQQSPSSYAPASSLTILRTESPFEYGASLERRSSMPHRSMRPALRTERASRIPHVGSRTSLASESTTTTLHSERPTPSVSRNPSPARRPILSKPKAPSRPRPKVPGPPAHHPPLVSTANSASTSRSSSPMKVSSHLPSHVHTYRQPSSERHKPPPLPPPVPALRSRPASQLSLRRQRPASVASASRPATSRPVHSRSSSSESSHATDAIAAVAAEPSRPGMGMRPGAPRSNAPPLRSMRSTTNLLAFGTGTATLRGRARSNTTSSVNVAQTGSATAISTVDNDIKRGPGIGSMRPPPLPPARTGLLHGSSSSSSSAAGLIVCVPGP